MSTNENIPASDERAKDTAPVAILSENEAPEPDITKAGRNLIVALLVLSAAIGAAQVFGYNLFRLSLADISESRGGGVSTSAAGAARDAGRTHALSSGSVELADGTTVNYVPVANAASLLLAAPDALRGDAKYLAVEGGDVAQIPALPSFEAVLDPAAAAAKAAAAKEEADAQAAADAAAEDVEAVEGDDTAEEESGEEAVEPDAAD